ncbi:low temperature requirement protein A [Micromonospora endolithica]|uniref:Low temperature requirement protein A n=1 Tax=Micromonospora endolithica TaxID=230091 RepID=A0A3A9ZT83_9ACTN|nr:low temperature requirement protein A [Micromonospora endolithica]
MSWGGPGTRVTRLELFYDLVFVFAFFNVTTLAAANLTVRTLLESLAVVALLWWCWTGFVAVGNVVRADQGIMPVIGFLIMAAVFVLALTTAVAFYDEPGGLPGPLVFACAYLVTWVVKVAALWSTTLPERGAVRRSVLLTIPTMSGALIILAAATLPQRLVPEHERDVRLALWAVALLLEYGFGLLLGRIGWRLRSVGHWAERHALIVLVALGESVIALGIGTTTRAGRPITVSVIAAAVLGIAVIATLWWLYFDVLAFAVEQALHGTRGPERIPLARDIYTYLHLPLIIGVILVALGLKRLLTGVIATPGRAARETLDGLDPLVLYGGVVVFLLALVAIEWRTFRRLDGLSLGGAALLAAGTPLAYLLPTLTALGLLTGLVGLVVLVRLRSTRHMRARVREKALSEQESLEAEANRWRRRHL